MIVDDDEAGPFGKSNWIIPILMIAFAFVAGFVELSHALSRATTGADTEVTTAAIKPAKEILKELASCFTVYSLR